MDQQSEDRVRLFVEAATWIMQQATFVFPQSYVVDRRALADHLGIGWKPSQDRDGQSHATYEKARGVADFDFYVGAVLTTLAAEGLCVNAHSNEVGLTFAGLERLRNGSILGV